jgi:hypothetical protein
MGRNTGGRETMASSRGFSRRSALTSPFSSLQHCYIRKLYRLTPVIQAFSFKASAISSYGILVHGSPD